MITLHGFAASNYYNVVKHVLLYKGIPFQEHLIYSGGDEWLSISPVGKVPAITTEDGRHLSETTVICDFIEETYPQLPLYPSDPGERAAVRQIMKVSELYLELPIRRLLAYAFSGKTAPEPLKDEIRHILARGIGAMTRLCKFSPWLAGDQQTMADIYVLYVMNLVGPIGAEQLDLEILSKIPGMKDWNTSMRSSDIAKKVDEGRVANQPGFKAYIAEFMEAQRTKKG